MNLRSQKGATGTDIMIAITVIILAISVVSMLYVNTTLQSRNITRTAGATRIATNILENIETMSYVDFIAEYNSSRWTTISSGKYATYKSANNVTTFSTKIPKGYTVYLYGEPNYGSYSSNSDRDKQFDLVRDIRLVVTYKVGDAVEEVDFTSYKTREITNEVNPPDLTVLFSQGIASDTKKVYPVKYSEEANAYLKTDENDLEWYNYSNKKWAMVIVSTHPETEIFDINGKLKAEATEYAKYTWIPKYFYIGEDDNKEIFEFAYLSSSDKAIKSKQELKATDNTTILYYNALGAKSALSVEPTTFVLSGNQKVSGRWISAGSLSNILNDEDGYLMNNSIYGPCEYH